MQITARGWRPAEYNLAGWPPPLTSTWILDLKLSPPAHQRPYH
jgi:hypothetical protein